MKGWLVHNTQRLQSLKNKIHHSTKQGRVSWTIWWKWGCPFECCAECNLFWLWSVFTGLFAHNFAGSWTITKAIIVDFCFTTSLQILLIFTRVLTLKMVSHIQCVAGVGDNSSTYSSHNLLFVWYHSIAVRYKAKIRPCFTLGFKTRNSDTMAFIHFLLCGYRTWAHVYCDIKLLISYRIMEFYVATYCMSQLSWHPYYLYH